ncbi:hypothetical protein HJG60_009490 [Phyllostomus discolor]|uniref:Uncharacterized protein n=1 Tax=Phyllostomus discolor TaxID=89673 RepID=A0A833YJ75_9CHIR|nr:hypothetical protein HJG60_009490 [Phyllostomus discolor]
MPPAAPWCLGHALGWGGGGGRTSVGRPRTGASWSFLLYDFPMGRSARPTLMLGCPCGLRAVPPAQSQPCSSQPSSRRCPVGAGPGAHSPPRFHGSLGESDTHGREEEAAECLSSPPGRRLGFLFLTSVLVSQLREDSVGIPGGSILGSGLRRSPENTGRASPMLSTGVGTRDPASQRPRTGAQCLMKVPGILAAVVSGQPRTALTQVTGSYCTLAVGVLPRSLGSPGSWPQGTCHTSYIFKGLNTMAQSQPCLTD